MSRYFFLFHALYLCLVFISAVSCVPAESPSRDAADDSTSIEGQDGEDKANGKKGELIIGLGTIKSTLIPESSGLAISSHVENAIWTINDSGNSTDLFLLKTSGEILSKIGLPQSKNIDWEAMSGFSVNGKHYLLLADVGDNQSGRSRCQLYVFVEPNLKLALADTPVEKLPLEGEQVTTRLEFSYEDGPRNCEAVGVDSAGKEIWLVEKIYITDTSAPAAGIYVLPLPLREISQPVVAKRIADFPIRNVTGMAFSPDGKRLIIRNYLNAHLYSRQQGETWKEVVQKTKPQTVLLPIQLQGEAVCFTPDSQSLIVTSEFGNQMIWQVKLDHYFEPQKQ